TAFLHSVMMQEKRGMLKIWNMWLIFATFLLCIFGTFLTRSGVVSSVHAFAQSSIGNWFVGFLALTFAVCVAAFVKNRSHLQSENRLESLVSRESSFLFNNLILLVACFTVLWGTLFPILSEWVQGHKVTVGPPFFNRVNIPVALHPFRKDGKKRTPEHGEAGNQQNQVIEQEAGLARNQRFQPVFALQVGAV